MRPSGYALNMPSRYSDGPEPKTGYALPERYGNRKVPKMIAAMDKWRKASREQGTPDIQNALDEVEPFIDFFFQEVARRG